MMKKLILVIGLILCLVTLTSCGKIESYEDMKTLNYEQVLSRSNVSPTGSYYVIVYRTDCEICKEILPTIAEYANIVKNSSKADPIYSLNRSDKKNNGGMTAESGVTVNKGLGATNYKDIKLCSSPVLLKVTDGKVVKLLDKRSTILAEFNKLISNAK